MRLSLYGLSRHAEETRGILRCTGVAAALGLLLGLAPLVASGEKPPPAPEWQGPAPPFPDAAPPSPDAEKSLGAAREKLREHTLAGVVGIRASLSEPRLTFKGTRKVTAEISPSEGTGSGVIVDRSGLILTCAHVIGDATRVRIFLADDREVVGTVKVSDRASDLALVAVQADSLSPLDLASPAHLRQGEPTFLASRPGGASIRFEEGTLAAAGTYHVGHSQFEFFRQFLGEIEPGDSGGALVDEEGRLIGILSVGVPEGKLGYAIAREFVIVALARLRTGPPVVWPWLGAAVEAPPDSTGALVWSIAPGSPAQAAGLKPGDRIVSLDGRTVDHFLPAILTVLSHPVGRRYELTVRRGKPGSVSGKETSGGGGKDTRGTGDKETSGVGGRETGGAGDSVKTATASQPARPDPEAPAKGTPGITPAASGPVAGTPVASAPVPKAGMPGDVVLSISSTVRPLEPELPPLELFEKLTGIRLGVVEGSHDIRRGIEVVGAPAHAEGHKGYKVGSRLVGILPGLGLVRALEEGRNDQEMKITNLEDLGLALRASSMGGRLSAALIWLTEGNRQTMLVSGEERRFPIL